MSYPSTRGWGPPGLRADQIARIRVPLEPVPMYVRREVAPLFEELVRWLDHERKKHGRPPLSSSGGYVKRYISGTRVWSNHSWGLAADFNAATNPYRRGPLITDMPPGTSEKARSLGMRWGGDYSGKKDAMHFEFMGTPEDARRIISLIRPPTPWLPTHFTDAEVLVAELPMLECPADYPAVQNTHHNVRTVQGLLVAATSVGMAPGFDLVDVDGNYGPGTRAAVLEYQRRMGLDVDGVVGPQTWRALLALPPQ